jgi:hypothetical protein
MRDLHKFSIEWKGASARGDSIRFFDKIYQPNSFFEKDDTSMKTYHIN